MPVTLRQLLYFVTIADAGSLSAAAETLRVAPTALSLQLKALETDFNVALMQRHSRGMRPTEAGIELYDRARAILSLVDETERALTVSTRAAKRTIRLGIPPGLARTIGFEAYIGIAERLDGATLRVVDGWSVDLLERLRQGELDFVVGYSLEPSAGIEVVDLFEDHFVFVSAPGESSAGNGANTSLTFHEALATDLLFYGEKSLSWVEVRKATQAAGLSFGAERHVESIELWRSLLSRGLGTSITTFGAISEEYHRGDVVIREISDHPIVPRLSAAYATDLIGQSWANTFVDFMVELLMSLQTSENIPFATLQRTY